MSELSYIPILAFTDLKRFGRVFRNFEHFQNRFLYAARFSPVLNDVTDYNPLFIIKKIIFRRLT